MKASKGQTRKRGGRKAVSQPEERVQEQQEEEIVVNNSTTSAPPPPMNKRKGKGSKGHDHQQAHGQVDGEVVLNIMAENGVRIIFAAVAAASSVTAFFRIVELGTPPALVFRFLTNWALLLHVISSLLIVVTGVERIAAALFERPELAVKAVDSFTRITETVYVIATSLCVLVSLLFWAGARLFGFEAMLSPELIDETLLMHQQHTIPFVSLLLDGLLFCHVNYYGFFKEFIMSCVTVILYGVTLPICSYMWKIDPGMVDNAGFCGNIRYPYPFLERVTNLGMVIISVMMVGFVVVSTFVSVSFRAFHAITTSNGSVPPPLDSHFHHASTVEKQD